MPIGTTSTIDVTGELQSNGRTEGLTEGYYNESDHIGDMERRRLAITANQNFAGISNLQGYVYMSICIVRCPLGPWVSLTLALQSCRLTPLIARQLRPARHHWNDRPESLRPSCQHAVRSV